MTKPKPKTKKKAPRSRERGPQKAPRKEKRSITISLEAGVYLSLGEYPAREAARIVTEAKKEGAKE